MPIIARENYWILETDRTAYAFGINAHGLLVHAYWGARLPQAADYPAPPDANDYASWSGPSKSSRIWMPPSAG